jgi:(p)ppGpp synthase/HD superfamily hydrolase
MIAQDRNDSIKRNAEVAEYLASFWNYEAVKKIREARESASQHSFADKEEFDRQVTSGDFKNNPIVQALKNSKKAENANLKYKDIKESESKKLKMPTDLDYLSKLGIGRK